MLKDNWKWNPTGAFHPLFKRESDRRDYLLKRSSLSYWETKELEEGYAPFAYEGATYCGHKVYVSRLTDGTNDRAPYLFNDPNKWVNLDPPFSVKNWPDGPPGWVPLVPGEHYPIDLKSLSWWAQLMGRVLQIPWDVDWSLKMRHK